jgi:hypothetical protein
MGQKLDRRLLHSDPEALMRARKQSKARVSAQQATAAAAAAAEAGAEAAGVEEGTASEQHQADQLPELNQLHQQQQQQADGEAAADVDMVDASTAAAGGTQQQQQLEESPAALKPVTNGVSRKRCASSADAAAECEGTRPAKSARQADTPTQLGPAVAADGSSSLGTGLEAATDQQQHLQAAGQQDDRQQQQQQPPERNAVLAPVQPLLPTPLRTAATADVQRAGELLEQVVAVSAGMQLSGLELLHARLSRVVAAHCRQEDRCAVLGQLANVIDGLQGHSS